MPLSMYEASAPVFVRALDNLTAILHKAVTHAAEHGIDPATLVGTRLAPDMYPLSGQIQRASDAAKLGIARLTGVQAPSFADTETTFDELLERIAKTTAFLNSLTPEQFADAESRAVVLNLRGTEVRFTGERYLLTFALPNFFFHVTTAYAILRHAGLPIGKADYLGPF
ncbi:MAG: DUF1993 domain-containing protein [Burkholderiales bacterium]|nr:DUF1993 domain-containing protein [Burkholderiales bacterium]